MQAIEKAPADVGASTGTMNQDFSGVNDSSIILSQNTVYFIIENLCRILGEENGLELVPELRRKEGVLAK